MKNIVKQCLILIGEPTESPEGRTPSILPGARASLIPGARPPASPVAFWPEENSAEIVLPPSDVPRFHVEAVDDPFDDEPSPEGSLAEDQQSDSPIAEEHFSAPSPEPEEDPFDWLDQYIGSSDRVKGELLAEATGLRDPVDDESDADGGARQRCGAKLQRLTSCELFHQSSLYGRQIRPSCL